MGVYAHTTSNVSESVRNKIARLPRGRVFSVDNIHVEGSHDTILRVLSRLVQEGKILRIQNSIYYKPEFNRFLKGRPVPPDVNEVIKVISNRNKETLQIHGSAAVNKLGLSTQVPLTKVFYTNGPSREVIIAGTRVKFIHTENQNILQASGTEVGMALSAKLSNDSYRVYTLLGDGEIQEGQVWEAAMFAGARKLDNLVVIVDNNGLQIDGKVDEVCSPYPIDKKFEAFNFHVINVADGNDMDQLRAAFDEAKATKGMPTAIIMKTVKGKGVSFMENQVGWHGKAPNDEQYAQAMEELEKAGEALCQK